MRLAIVGVGQTLDFESGDMRDVLEVQLPDGSTITVPTSNEAANQLVQLVMGNGGPQRMGLPELREDDPMSQQLGQAFEQADGQRVQVVPQDYDGPQPLGEMTADGAVFGGAESQLIETIEEAERLPTRQQASAGAKQDDRSGVPSRTLPANMVDESGSPVLLPAPTGLTDDDDDDPGEQL
jgi:hypothetical protein